MARPLAVRRDVPFREARRWLHRVLADPPGRITEMIPPWEAKRAVRTAARRMTGFLAPTQ